MRLKVKGNNKCETRIPWKKRKQRQKKIWQYQSLDCKKQAVSHTERRANKRTDKQLIIPEEYMDRKTNRITYCGKNGSAKNSSWKIKNTITI